MHEEFTIQEAATATGTTPAVLRAWENRYKWPRPFVRPNGYRYYTLAHVDQIRQVRDLQAAGRTIGEIIVDGVPQLSVDTMTPLEQVAVLHRLVAEMRYLLAMTPSAYWTEAAAKLRAAALSPGLLRIRVVSAIEHAHRERDAARSDADRLTRTVIEQQRWKIRATRLLVRLIARARLWRNRANRKERA